MSPVIEQRVLLDHYAWWLLQVLEGEDYGLFSCLILLGVRSLLGQLLRARHFLSLRIRGSDRISGPSAACDINASRSRDDFFCRGQDLSRSSFDWPVCWTYPGNNLSATSRISADDRVQVIGPFFAFLRSEPPNYKPIPTLRQINV